MRLSIQNFARRISERGVEQIDASARTSNRILAMIGLIWSCAGDGRAGNSWPVLLANQAPKSSRDTPTSQRTPIKVGRAVPSRPLVSPGPSLEAEATMPPVRACSLVPLYWRIPADALPLRTKCLVGAVRPHVT